MSEANELGRRAVACKAWRWMPGMRYWYPGFRIGDTEWAHRVQDDPEHMEALHDNEGETPERYPLPDLSDPATLGCLLALVREAWPSGADVFAPSRFTCNEPAWTIADAVDDWVCGVPGGQQFTGKSEAEALVAALEAAP